MEGQGGRFTQWALFPLRIPCPASLVTCTSTLTRPCEFMCSAKNNRFFSYSSFPGDCSCLFCHCTPFRLNFCTYSNEQSPCINNWFRLTVGLINKEYKEKQTAAKAQQMLHFRYREAFIDEQMENSTYNREPKPGEVERRASLLHDLVVSDLELHFKPNVN
jgi:hypothetical protein